MFGLKTKYSVYLSLRWKIMALLGIVLALITVSLIYWTSTNQTNNFEKNRDKINVMQLNQLKVMLTEQALKIAQVSSLIGSIASPDNQAIAEAETWDNAQKRVDKAWAALQLDYGLESIRIYNRQQKIVADWSILAKANALEVRQIAEAMRQESSITWIDCVDACQQYAAMPILHRGDVAGAVVVSSTMADLILSFHRISNADVGFVLNGGVAGEANFLANLGMHVAGLSNANVNFPVLQHLDSIPLPIENSNWLRLELEGSFHEMAFLPIDDLQGRLQAMIVIIDDITDTMDEMQNYVRQRIQAGMLISLLLMLLIYFLLKMPLQRISKAVQAIPLIGERNYDAARNNLDIRSDPLISDEVDKLTGAAIQLTNTLQTLEKEANIHQSEILEMLQRISQAKDFSERILDTAQVIMITQELDGSINSLNHYGHELLDGNNDTLQGKQLKNAFKIKEDRTLFERNYAKITNKEIDHYYQECLVLCCQSEERTIAWHHSRMSGEKIQILSVGVDITLRKKSEEKSLFLAYYDQLTHLPNRRLMIDRIEHAMSASARNDKEGAILFLDLDRFKILNDTLGHDVGDLLLQQVAERLSSCLREGDSISRFGGDEFVILLEGLSTQPIEASTQAEDIAKKILITISEPYELAHHHYSSSTSIGITLFGEHKYEVEELLTQADIAMYQAKSNGRNALCFFDPQMQSTITSLAALEKELKQAIEQQQFELYYQIQVGINGQALGAEALIRWNHPEQGMITPFNFIPLAEDTGLILPIGQWVLNAACAQLKIWQKTPQTKGLVLAVNVSAKQFFQVDFVGQVLATIEFHGIDPTRLKLELTESMLVDNINDIIIKMDALSKTGIHFSLDDFGTGYSSLQYLKKLPLNQLKIDQSFVRDLVSDSSDRAIVRTIITMAHSLGIDVIAEGVETTEQRQYLLDNGCMYYQGYLFSKPVPLSKFDTLINDLNSHI